MRLLLAFAIPFALIGAAVLFAPNHGVETAASVSSGEPTAPQPVAKPVEAARTSPAQTGARAGSAPLPGSLEGTEPDGAWPLDGHNHLRPGPDVLRRLDYHFSTAGEEPEAAILARIRAELAALPQPGRGEAEALLEKYLRYRARGHELVGATFPNDAARLDAVIRLRREVFGADADALFGADERATRLGLAERQAILDPKLDPSERSQKIDAIEAQRAEAERLARSSTNEVAARAAEESELRREGATPDDVHQFRLQAVGPEATARLEALDAERAAWKARFEAFEAERANLSADAAEQLLKQRFSEPEQLRVRALERMRAAR